LGRALIRISPVFRRPADKDQLNQGAFLLFQVVQRTDQDAHRIGSLDRALALIAGLGQIIGAAELAPGAEREVCRSPEGAARRRDAAVAGVDGILLCRQRAKRHLSIPSLKLELGMPDDVLRATQEDALSAVVAGQF
jgi:hypothetical protein